MGSRSVRALSAISGVFVALAIAVVGVLPANAAGHRTMVLSGEVLPGISKLSPLAPTDPSQWIEVDLAIARPDPRGEVATYRAMYTPGNPSYHHFLTPAQFDRRFGVSRAVFAKVSSFATAKGLHLVDATGSRDFLELSGSVAQVERTFRVSLKDFRFAGGRFFANVNAATVPAGLGIYGVIGLNSLQRMHTFHSAPPASARHGAAPAQSLCGGGECIGDTTPHDLWSIYGQPTDINNPKADFGQGQRMAVFGEGQTQDVINNLRTFESKYKLPKVPIHVVHTDGPKANYGDDSGEIEWDLDSQSSTGMSPKVYGETFYFGKDLSDQSVLGMFNTWADDPHGPLQANASFGECEENAPGDTLYGPSGYLQTPEAGYAGSAGPQFTSGAEAALMKANMEGRTLFSSAGDTGSSCPVIYATIIGAGNGVANQAYPVPNYPASSPHAVDVGGTVLYGTDSPNPQRAQEYAWTFTGGGTSFRFAKPSFQDGIPAITGVCVPPGPALTPCRGAPDVAAQSGDVISNGYTIETNQGEIGEGGTSLSSPLWMGMWTRVQAAAPAVHGSYPGLGFADTTLYRLGKHATTDVRDFFDIGGGAPKSPPTSDGYYVSTPRNSANPTGWDYVSGLGSPNVLNLIKDADHGNTVPTHNVTPPPATSGKPTGSEQAACLPLFTDPAGDDAYVLDPNGGGSYPQLDIIKGDMHVASGSKLETILTMTNLSTSVPPGGTANEYYMLWTYKNTTYFANAEVAVTGTVTYSDGTVSGGQFTTDNSDDTGKLTLGKDGTVQIDVPLSHVGSPVHGDTLTATYGETYVEEGAPGVGGALESVDRAPNSGSGRDYLLGEICAATGRQGTSGISGASAHRLRIRLTVRPSHTTTGRRTRFVFHATTRSHGHTRAVAGALITLGGRARHARTNRRGTAVIVTSFNDPGRYTARAHKRGDRDGLASLRVTPQTTGPPFTG